MGHVPSERGLEAVGKSVRLLIISRSKVFDLFPRTDKEKNRCVLSQKYALINSRERSKNLTSIRRYRFTRNMQYNGLDVKVEKQKNPYFMRVSAFFLI